MAQGNFDLNNVQQFGQNLDNIQAKLSKILATVAAINAAMGTGGLPSQRAQAGTMPGNAATATPGGNPNTGGLGGLAGNIGVPALNGLPQGVVAQSGMNPSLQQGMLNSVNVGMPGGGGPQSNNGSWVFQPGNGPGNAGVASPWGGNSNLPHVIGYGSRVAGQAINYSADRAMNGGDDPLGRGSMVATGISAAIGIGVGAFGGPAVGAMAFGASETVLQPLSRYIMAPTANRQAAVQTMQPFLGAYAGTGAGKWDDYFTDPGQLPFGVFPGSPRAASMTRLGKMSGYINSRVPDALAMDDYGKDAGATLSGVSSGLFQGGIDPFSAGEGFDSGVYYPFDRNIGGINGRQMMERSKGSFRNGQRGQSAIGGGFSLVQGLVQGGIGAIESQPRRYKSDETLAETYTRRLGTLFGNEAPEVSKQIAPIFGSLPETGGNVADILTRFGAQNTSTFLRIHNDKLESSVDPMVLARTSAAIRGSERDAHIGGLQARGSGAALTSAYTRESESIASLPDGKDSEAYAEAQAKRRDAGRLAFDQKSIESYGLPMTKLQGERERAELLPFSPGNLFRLDIKSILLNKQRIGQLSGYMNERRASGQLSEQEELDLTTKIESSKTAQARDIAELGEGFINKLPSMSAGSPSFSGRLTSYSAAAAQLALMGSPIRGFGASNGRQLQSQDAFVEALGASNGDIAPRSRTSGLNSAGADNGQVVSLLARAVEALERISGGGGGDSSRPGEVAGNAYSAIASRNIGPTNPRSTQN